MNGAVRMGSFNEDEDDDDESENTATDFCGLSFRCIGSTSEDSLCSSKT